MSTNGLYYGITQKGGMYGKGTVFQMMPSGNSGMVTTLYSFCAESGCPDGQNPMNGLVLGPDRNLYGTTFSGGAHGGGTVFQITPTGTLTTLYNFCSMSGCTDGIGPQAPLVLGSNGHLYGVTSGKSSSGAVNHGTIFEITLSGVLTQLHTFEGTDGHKPSALVLANDGNFYGTTLAGGTGNPRNGTIFRMTPAGTLTVIHNFCSEANCTSGGTPLARLALSSDGNHLYGTASTNGAYGFGTIFASTLSGTTNSLYSFCAPTPPPACPDGGDPAALTQATTGLFYGTTLGGGAFGDGTVFTLNTGAPQFIETIPAGAAVNSPVVILGSALSGATSVTFNGTSAMIDTDTATAITTNVPAGATSGKVQVMTTTTFSTVVFSTVVPFLVLP